MTWTPPSSAEELAGRIRAALEDVGENHGLRIRPCPRRAAGEDCVLWTYPDVGIPGLPCVINYGRIVPDPWWTRACQLALFGRFVGDRTGAGDAHKSPRSALLLEELLGP